MMRFFLRVDLNGKTYDRPWLPFYIETKHAPKKTDVILSRMWCPKHGDDGIYQWGKMVCCRFENIMTEQFQKELAERELLLESCTQGRIVVVYDLDGNVEPLVDSIDIKTWDERDNLVSMRYFEFAE